MTHGGRRPGAGRKPDRGLSRTEWISLRVAEADKAEISAAAEEVGQSLSEFLVDAGLTRARSRRK